jgi:hypothetical protein
MLDWYFDCEGGAHSLKHWLTAAPAAAASTAPHTKPHRGTLYTTFHACLDKFRKTALSFEHDPRLRSILAGWHPECHIWLRHDDYALDLHNARPGDAAQVWLGLGRMEDGFRPPVAIKRNQDDKDPRAQEQNRFRLKRVMRKLKPGSFIASAELVQIEPVHLQQQGAAAAAALDEEAQGPHSRTSSASRQERWVSEAGVCTLQELFAQAFTPADIAERCSKMHRMLVKEILQSMVLAVFHLHECKIVHRNISLAYFKVFLIEEPPRATNLRVKLVSMKNANVYTPDNTAEVTKDIQDLARAMMEVVLGDKKQFEPQNASSLEDPFVKSETQVAMVAKVQSYDPSLFLLIDWMLNGATLADVIRHPYFMSLNEKEAFTLALEGDVFSSIASASEVSAPFVFVALIARTVFNEVTCPLPSAFCACRHLLHQLDRSLEGLKNFVLLPFIHRLFGQLQ